MFAEKRQTDSTHSKTLSENEPSRKNSSSKEEIASLANAGYGPELISTRPEHNHLHQKTGLEENDNDEIEGIPKIHQRHLSGIGYIGVHCVHGEKALMFIRRHWLFEVLIALQGLVFALIPFLIWFFIRGLLIEWSLPVLFFVLIYIQFVLFYTLKRWLDFYLDTIIVTSHKIIDIDQVGFFNRQISETSLVQIQDAMGHLQGFLGTMLKFGKIEIQTAGNELNFSLDKVAHPIETAAVIEDIQARYLQNMSLAAEHASGA